MLHCCVCVCVYDGGLLWAIWCCARNEAIAYCLISSCSVRSLNRHVLSFCVVELAYSSVNCYVALCSRCSQRSQSVTRCARAMRVRE
jgi:hypothetical protein